MARADVLVIGAGTAGATVAWKCARRGLRVCLVDGRGRTNAGSWWINGVEARLFDDLDLGPPVPPVVFNETSAFHIETPSGRRVTCPTVPTVEVDMGALTKDLLDRAEKAGVELRFRHKFESVELVGDRVDGARFRNGAKGHAIRALVTVDAGGLDGTLRARLPTHLWRRERVDKADICVAAQQVRDIADRNAALRFLDRHRLRGGETLCWTGLRGGYSILNVTVDLERERVSLLTGAMISEGSRAGIELVEEGLERLGFAGRKLSGGGGLIPVRRAFDQLVGNGYALIGNAASQVFPSHGSGVAAGMRAADLLANALVNALDRGRVDTAGLWAYAANYQRGRGALCASHECVRRLSQTLSTPELEIMLDSGMLDGRATAQSLACEPLSLSVRQLAGVARGAVRSPRLVGRILATAVQSARVLHHYRKYPRRFDRGAFARWRAGRARLAPD